ncbi:MAG TPA: DinB family protein [Ktedonobacterales bacterium]|jgi:hypothetical protein|nr:DinB family protein [Ktedonobacterales bacterium]
MAFETVTVIRRRVEADETTIEEAAADFSLAELAGGLRMTRGTLQALVDGWTQGQLSYLPPARAATREEDRWSATMALSHLIATENWYLMHMGRLQGRREHFDVMPRGLGDHARQGVPQQELSEQLHAATERMLKEIANIPPNADLNARRDSTFFGELGLRGWVMLAIIHDQDHLEQIERLTEYADFPTA